MRSVTLDIAGLPEMQARIDALMPRVVAVAAHALDTEATAILTASRPLVPVDTGLLVSTGLVEGPSQSGAESTVTISYGGHGLAPYAVVVHERTDTHHPIGQHHYLSTAFYAATAGMLSRLAATMRQTLGA